MSATLIALLMVPMLQSPTPPVGDPAAGQQAFSGGAAFCMICHGGKGQGAFGPDLAGRGLSFAQFKRAVTEPWGIMPSFENLDDQTIANMHAFLEGLPKVAEAGRPGNPAPPPGSPLGQHLFMTLGCGQCHRNEASDPRRDMGAFGKQMSYDVFARIVYGGERRAYAVRVPPPMRMGKFSPDKLPEPALREIYRWLTEETGLRVPMTAEIEKPVRAGGNSTYTLKVENEGNKAYGLTAEDVTISLVLPAGAKVVSATGPGYQGVERSDMRQTDSAVWRVPKIDAHETLTFTLTLAGTAPVGKDMFMDSMVRWERPEIRRPKNQTMLDDRVPNEPGFNGDWITTVGVAQRPDGRVLPLFVRPPAE